MKFFIRTTLERSLDESYSQIEYELLVDTEHNARKSFVEQLEFLSTLKEDVVILEDDLILCKNFKERIEEVISKYPKEIINFFYAPNRYFSSYISEEFCWNQCVYYPADKLKRLAVEMRKQYSFYPDTAHDVVEDRALKMLGILNYIYRPCLVQHTDYSSLISPGNAPRRTPYFVDYLEELGISYEEAYEHKKELKDLLDSKFRRHF